MLRLTPGSTYIPDCGQHAGHTIVVVSANAVALGCAFNPDSGAFEGADTVGVPGTLVRCRTDLASWTIPTRRPRWYLLPGGQVGVVVPRGPRACILAALAWLSVLRLAVRWISGARPTSRTSQRGRR